LAECYITDRSIDLAAYRAFAIGYRISEIRAPALAMACDSDILIPPENGRILAEKIPGAEFREIEGRGDSSGSDIRTRRWRWRSFWRVEISFCIIQSIPSLDSCYQLIHSAIEIHYTFTILFI